MSSPRPPRPPDPDKVAGAQTQQNIESGISNFMLNAVDQETPYGSINYVLDEDNPYQQHTYTIGDEEKTVDIPNYVARQTLTPELQGLLDKRISNQGAIGDLAARRLAGLGETTLGPNELVSRDFEGLFNPQVSRDFEELFNPQASRDFEDLFNVSGRDYNFDKLYDPYHDSTGVGDALLSRLEPGLASDSERLSNDLERRGISRGSALWERAMRDSSIGRNEARATAIIRGAAEDRATAELRANLKSIGYGEQRSDASLSAQLRDLGITHERADTGLRAQLRDLGITHERADTGLRAQLRDLGITHERADRSTEVNEALALLGASRGDQFTPLNTYQSSIPTTDYAGIVDSNYNQRLQGWQQQMQSRNALIQGLLGFGGNVGKALVMGG